jgi:hypothetical protein
MFDFTVSENETSKLRFSKYFYVCAQYTENVIGCIIRKTWVSHKGMPVFIY